MLVGMAFHYAGMLHAESSCGEHVECDLVERELDHANYHIYKYHTMDTAAVSVDNTWQVYQRHRRHHNNLHTECILSCGVNSQV